MQVVVMIVNLDLMSIRNLAAASAEKATTSGKLTSNHLESSFCRLAPFITPHRIYCRCSRTLVRQLDHIPDKQPLERQGN